MRKTKDWEWGLSPDANGKYEFPAAQLAVMMDIRDELKSLNTVLHCPNFMDIPHKLDRIKRNTAKKRKPKAVGNQKLRVVNRNG